MKRFCHNSASHSRESGNPPLVGQKQNYLVDLFLQRRWIPAFAGMTCCGVIIFFFTLTTLVSNPSPAFAEATTIEPIKLGEIFAYSAIPDAALKWQQGWKLALKEINDAGGVLGKPLEIISRDDKGNPNETIKILEEFKNRENIRIFFGTALSHTGLVASSFAKQNKMLLFRGYGGTSELTAQAGHDLYLQVQAPSDLFAGILAEKVAQTGKKRWAFVAADYAFSRSIIEVFQRDIKRLNPQVEFVETQYFPIGKLDAGAVAQAVGHAKPDGIFVVVWGSDYLRFVREGRKRGLFDDRMVIGPYTGYTSYIKPLGKEAPVGWLSGEGYPINKITGTAHKTFVANFKKDFNDEPDYSSFTAYSIVKILAKAITAVGTDDPEKVVAYIKNNKFEVPGITLSFRADGISNLGDWVGLTGFENGAPTILNPEYFEPEKYLPTVEENLKLREGKKP